MLGRVANTVVLREEERQLLEGQVQRGSYCTPRCPLADSG